MTFFAVASDAVTIGGSNANIYRNAPDYAQEGSYTVTARADYYSGQSVVGGATARVDVHRQSLVDFPGGPECNQRSSCASARG